MFECENGQCIRTALLCNGIPDCTDGSDEDSSTVCATTSCQVDEFDCGPSGGGCVPEEYRCDGYTDCGDGSDEKDCPVMTWNVTVFSCENGQWVSRLVLCDGDVDCDDGSDESVEICHTMPMCAGNEFQCDSPGRSCVPLNVVCDGYEDCVGGSDERNCEGSACSFDGEFPCKSGQCVPKASLCDGRLDCEDGSDEHRTICSLEKKCAEEEFACKNPRETCVPIAFRCDGGLNCEDESDERGC
ncbi:hypothetical protein MTO96_042974 [Rhipicephalus appendiculatus]